MANKKQSFRVLMNIGNASKIKHKAGAKIDLDPEAATTLRWLKAGAIETVAESEDPDAEARAKAKAEEEARQKAEADRKAAEDAAKQNDPETQAKIDARRSELQDLNREQLENAARDAGVAGIGKLNMENLVEAVIEAEQSKPDEGED